MREGLDRRLRIERVFAEAEVEPLFQIRGKCDDCNRIQPEASERRANVDFARGQAGQLADAGDDPRLNLRFARGQVGFLFHVRNPPLPYAALQLTRRTFPLDVFGMLPDSNSITA